MVQRLGFHEIVVRFHFLQLRGGGDDEKPRFARALFVKQPNQVRSNERVACDLDGELAAVGRRLEFDARSIQPSLGRPRIELADGRKRFGRADLDCDGIEMVERRCGGLRSKAQRTKLKAQNEDRAPISKPQPWQRDWSLFLEHSLEL